MRPSTLYLLSSILFLCLTALASDFPQWGRDNSRNMVSPETNLPDTFDPGKPDPDGKLDLKQTKNIKWAARLGTHTHGKPGGSRQPGCCPCTIRSPPHPPSPLG